MTDRIQIFDGHNDTLLRLHLKQGEDPVKAFLEGDGAGHIDLPRAREGGLVGGLFAIFVRSPEGRSADVEAMMQQPRYDVPLPAGFGSERALAETLAMASILFRIERSSEGRVKICRDTADIASAVEAGALAAVLHIEGAEAIDARFDNLEVLYQAGLRSLGPVWSRSNIFGHGVPFRFPSTPDTGPGLTDLGKELVRRCNGLGVMIDLSHITEAGFWDVAEISDAPLVASHSNAHAVTPHARNLTDRQLAAIRESGGLVGVNYATAFLRPDGRMTTDTPLEMMLRHVDHLVEQLGIDHVGLGSDFDGAAIPREIGDAAGLPNLVVAMREHGYSAKEIQNICFDNWLSVLERTWKNPR
ncbi:dipeptidase [Aquamicrobium sp. LC103]|uniref:dipeptidase n=1 Tax=Aquamicrobium sp. LC103 TaxID=1120658 RepID=UPI00063E7DE8|nr:dipeptidase [Aquamicrobium sp. LC103]TKT74669.1 membrane dipeptidase [Aquamicrobium sp. LC103]